MSCMDEGDAGELVITIPDEVLAQESANSGDQLIQSLGDMMDIVPNGNVAAETNSYTVVIDYKVSRPNCGAYFVAPDDAVCPNVLSTFNSF